MASGDGFKWSRNLREEHVTEANRVRLIERQKQLLETKRNRQPQVTASRLSKSAGVPASRSSDRLLDPEEEEGRNELHGLLNHSLSPEQELPAEQEPQQRKAEPESPPQDQDPFSSGENLSDVVGDSSPEAGSPVSEKREHEVRSVAAPNPLTTILTSSELFEFVSQAVSASQIFQCTIIRDKRGIDRSLYPTYFMYLQSIIGGSSDTMGQEAREKVMRHLPVSCEGREAGTRATTRQVFLLCGRRRKKSKTYLIGLDPFDISRINCVAKLKSNVIGTQFRAVRVGRSGQRSEEASIIYDTNVLGFKGPRKMTASIPKPTTTPITTPTAAQAPLDPSSGYKRNNNGIIHLKNKTPVWNEESQSYVLNFHGRVTQASVKNFQLIASDPDDQTPSHWDTDLLKANQRQDFAPTLPASSGSSPQQALDPGVCLQFGRVSDKEFTCDITSPLSPLQAFAIALSSFDSKLACE